MLKSYSHHYTGVIIPSSKGWKLIKIGPTEQSAQHPEQKAEVLQKYQAGIWIHKSGVQRGIQSGGRHTVLTQGGHHDQKN